MLASFAIAYLTSLLFPKPSADKLKGLTVWVKSD